MKKLYALLFTLLISALSYGQVILAEDFAYPDGALVPNGGWVQNTGTSGTFVISSEQAIVDHSQSEDVRFSFSAVTGDVYAAFDFTVPDLGSPFSGSDFEYFAHLAFNARVDLVAPSGAGDFSVGLSTNTSAAQVTWASDLNYGQTYRVVIKYDQVAGVATLWIDPSAEGDTSISGDVDATPGTADSMDFRQSTSDNSEVINIDDLMVGQTFSDVLVFMASTNPDINFAALSGTMSYDVGSGPSNEVTFSVEGTNLTDDITLTPPTNFEISTMSGSGFTTSPIVITQSGGTVNSTTIYVRLVSMLSIGNYTGDLTGSSPGATDRLLNLSGDVVDGSLTNVGITGNVDGVYINELHYDNDGGDIGEFIEVAGPAGTDLSVYTISLYNGSDSELYGSNDTFVLSGTIDDEGSGVGAVALLIPTGIQNGGPDGIALSKSGSSDIQFLSYEGVISNAGDGPAAGLTSEDIGVSEGGTTPAGWSLEYDEGTMSWVVVTDDTPDVFAQGTLSNNDFNKNSFSIYPNPTSTGQVSISSIDAGIMDVAVYDVLGKQVKRQSITSTLDVSNLRSGVYILKITQNNATSTKKLVIK